MFMLKKFTPRARTVLACILAVCMVFSHVGEAEAAKRKKRSSAKRANVTQQDGTKSPRYSAIIMNPVTGEVYHSQNADAQRYPASLTKMMTLYLLFEALEQKKIDLDDRMDVSAYAARMPQTNLALDEGDRIEVETAIKALVVRSANDVSVVIAERLGGDVETFGKMMTAKARMLGMKNTVFKNPNGLPNPDQHTTARDMAKLGIALKRDFPKYYPYFSTLQFSHNGVTYYTHNRVLLRYAGTDGIKTGYIGASGFNLVSSVVRGGRPVVGAVMGGSSGRWRDDRMINLLDDAYRTIASRGAAKGRNYPGNLPAPKPGSKKAGIEIDPKSITEDGLASSGDVNPAAEMADTGSEETMVDNSMDVEVMAVDANADKKEAAAVSSPFEAAERAAVEVRDTRGASAGTKPASVKPQKITLAPDSKAPQPTKPAGGKPAVVLAPTAPSAPTPREVRDAANPKAAMGDRVWGVQVGAFSSQDQASQAMRSALEVAAKPLAEARMSMLAPQTSGSTTIFRARLENLTQKEAKSACEMLISHNSPCFIYNAAP